MQSKPERRSTPLGRSSLNMSRQAKERIMGSSPPAHEFAELLRDPWRVSKTSASAVNRLSVRCAAAAGCWVPGGQDKQRRTGSRLSELTQACCHSCWRCPQLAVSENNNEGAPPAV